MKEQRPGVLTKPPPPYLSPAIPSSDRKPNTQLSSCSPFGEEKSHREGRKRVEENRKFSTLRHSTLTSEQSCPHPGWGEQAARELCRHTEKERGGEGRGKASGEGRGKRNEGSKAERREGGKKEKAGKIKEKRMRGKRKGERKEGRKERRREGEGRRERKRGNRKVEKEEERGRKKNPTWTTTARKRSRRKSLIMVPSQLCAPSLQSCPVLRPHGP